MSASATPMPINGVGSVVTPQISLTNVYYVPTLPLNLPSVFCCVSMVVRSSSLILYVIFKINSLIGWLGSAIDLGSILSSSNYKHLMLLPLVSIFHLFVYKQSSTFIFGILV